MNILATTHSIGLDSRHGFNTLKEFSLTAEALFQRGVSKLYALFLWKFYIFRRYEGREGDCHRFADMLKNCSNKIWNVNFQPYRAWRLLGLAEC